jgi:hypothetical protein
MATRPQAYLSWTDGASTHVANPPQSVHASGYQAGAPLPAAYLNYCFFLLDNWVQFLDATNNAESLTTSLGESLRLLGGGQLSFNLSTRVLAWSEPLYLSYPSVPDTDNVIAAGQVVLGVGQVAYVQSNAPFSTTADAQFSEDTLSNVAYTLGIVVNQAVTGPGIAQGTTVQAIDGSTVTLSQAVGATAAQATFTFASSGNLAMQVASVGSLVPNASTVVLARGTLSTAHVGVLGGIATLRDGERKALGGAGYLAVVTAPLGQTVTQRACLYISPGAGDTSSGAGDLTAGSTTVVNLSATNELSVGLGISGTGIPSGTTVTGISGKTLTLSNAATQTAAAQGLTYTRVAGTAYLANTSLLLGANRYRPIGFAITAVSAEVTKAVTVNICTGGSVPGFTSLTPGAVYYLDPQTPGGITPTRPAKGSYIAVAGVATAADTLYVSQWFGGGLDLDGLYNDVVVKPITGASNPVGLRVQDGSGNTLFSADGAGITQATQMQLLPGSAQYPAFAYQNQTDTGGYLATQSPTAAVLGWALNGVRTLAMSAANGLVSTLSFTAPLITGTSVVSSKGFCAIVDFGTYSAGNNAQGTASAPTSYDNMQVSVYNIAAGAATVMPSTYLTDRPGSIIGCSAYLLTPVTSANAYAVQVVVTTGANSNTWSALQNQTGSNTNTTARNNYPFVAGSSISVQVKFATASAVTRMRVQLTFEYGA